MKKRNLFLIFVLALIAVVVIAAVPVEEPDLVKLKIENNSDDYVTYKLDGPEYYYLMIASGSTKTFTIERGDYSTQVFYACGRFIDTTIDFNNQQSIVVPSCGEKAFASDVKKTTIDGGQLLKLVKVTFENPFDYNMLLVLTGPDTHVFLIEAGNKESYTIVKDTFDVTQYGCEYVRTFKYYPYANKVTELECPTW